MVLTADRPEVARGKAKYAVIDCDIHPNLASPDALDKYLPERWRLHRQTIGGRGFSGSYYPRAARTDAWPPNVKPPSSDLDFMRYQLLDAYDMDFGVMQPLLGSGGQRNLEWGAAHAAAVNEWQIETWLDPEPRLRSGLVVPYEDGELTVKEIERRGSHPGFVQLMLAIRTSEPLGRRKYWKMYEAAEAH